MGEVVRRLPDGWNSSYPGTPRHRQTGVFKLATLQLSRKGELLFAAGGIVIVPNACAAVFLNMFDQGAGREESLRATRAAEVLLGRVKLEEVSLERFPKGMIMRCLPPYGGDPQPRDWKIAACTCGNGSAYHPALAAPASVPREQPC